LDPEDRLLSTPERGVLLITEDPRLDQEPNPFGRLEREARAASLHHTKDRGRGPLLRFTEGEWRAFVLGVKDGEFD
jgi:hypothetical protein